MNLTFFFFTTQKEVGDILTLYVSSCVFAWITAVPKSNETPDFFFLIDFQSGIIQIGMSQQFHSVLVLKNSKEILQTCKTIHRRCRALASTVGCAKMRLVDVAFDAINHTTWRAELC
jgi:hypothetical protein